MGHICRKFVIKTMDELYFFLVTNKFTMLSTIILNGVMVGDVMLSVVALAKHQYWTLLALEICG